MSIKRLISGLDRMNRLQDKTKVRWIIFVCLSVVVIFLYLHLFYNRAYFELEISSNIKREYFKIYWAGDAQPFSEDRSVALKIHGGKRRHYGLYFTDLRKVRHLRIDPGNKPGKKKIHTIVLTQEEIKPIKLHGYGFKNLEVVRDISTVAIGRDGILIEATGPDPSLLWNIKPKIVSSGVSAEPIRVITLVILSWLLAYGLTATSDLLIRMEDTLWWLVLGLVIIMAFTSAYNMHPDEYVHASAGKYYETHWLPPEICQPDTADTYSVYGVSRLTSKEIVYFLSGKVASVFSFLPIFGYLRLRLFNVLLFALIVLSWHRHKQGALLFLPFLITPQVWYVFSYMNSDAFACFVALVLCQQFAFKETFLKRCWYAQEGAPWLLPRTIAAGMLLGLLLFTKPNYYIIYVFLGGYLLLEVFFSRQGVKVPLRRVAGLLGGVLVIGAIAFGPNILVNGFDRKQKINECRDRLATTPYKPSTPLAQKSPNLHLKQRGYRIGYLIKERKWFGIVFRSSVGVFGYMKYAGPQKYYNTMRVLLIILLVSVFAMGLAGSDPKGRLLMLWTLGCVFLLIAIVLYRCWVADFQSQGRYLLPVLPMAGFMMHKVRSAIDRPLLHVATVVVFLASCYSFVYIGLTQTPKI